MSQNPYQPSPSTAPTLAADEQLVRGLRPVGIWQLSGLHFLAGLTLLTMAFGLLIAAAAGWEDATGPIKADWILTIGLCALATYAIGSGIGLWRGDRWGWWLSAFYWVGLATNWIGDGCVKVWMSRDDDPVFLAGLSVMALVRMLIPIFLVLYHFKRSVRSFFGLQSLRMIRTIAILGAIWFALAFVVAIGVFIYMINTR